MFKKQGLVRVGLVAAGLALMGTAVAVSAPAEKMAYSRAHTGKVFRIADSVLAEKGLLEKTGIGKAESAKYVPELDENWVFTLTNDGKVEVTGNAAIQFRGNTTWKITAPQGQELDSVYTQWGTLYLGRLDGTVITKKGSEPVTMRVIYDPDTEQTKVNAVIGTVSDPLLLQFGESFIDEQELYASLVEERSN